MMNEGERWLCPYCGLTFTRRDSLERHENSIHRKITSFSSWNPKHEALPPRTWCPPMEARRVSTPSDVVGFYGDRDMLSNMFLCPLVKDKQTFKCSESLYQYEKAKFHNRWDLAVLIQLARNGYQAKKITRNIQVNEDWLNARLRIMKDICHLKLIQCSDVRRFLRSTCRRVLIEANGKDQFWGAGIYKSALNTRTEYPGRNHLGLIYMDLRERLTEED
jgi:ribA/ribD-fused uncharacterized protein